MNGTTLDLIKRGKIITVLGLPKGEFKNHLLRIGISEGDTIRCVERLPGGTIVIQKNRQEIAIGFELARQILVIQQER